uniref:Odorant receptor n=1 Tax=Dendrolimus punctatus TaxID=238572 RepID=A0A2K8GKR2_9NEOP|nr:Odorant Receptor 13 [Dendrolimus punctatus]
MAIPTYDELFKQIKINFWLCGMPYGDDKIHVRFYVILLLIILMLVEEIGFFVSKISSENILELTQLAPCMGIGFLSMLKILAIAVKRCKIFALTEKLRCLYEEILKDPVKIKTTQRNLIIVKEFTKYFFILNAILISVYNFSTLVIILYNYVTKKVVIFKLPYAVLLPFPTDSWLPWFFVYVHSVSCGFICVLYFTTVDVLYCLLTSHICCNFSVISSKIKCLNASNAAGLREIVKSHQYILKLSEDLEDIFTAPNLFNVLIGSIQLCALGFNLTTRDLARYPGNILFLSSVILQILMMSVFGENVIQESTKVGEAAFMCKWYEMDIKSKKTILTIMIRARKPQRLTAYKFSVISYGSFSKIISTSWTYFTILRTVYKSPERK